MRRLSRNVSWAQAQNLNGAVKFAHERGWALNRLVTVLWEQADVVGRFGDAQARFLERMRKWLQYRGVEAVWIWVFENGPEMGLHSHILVHVPGEHFHDWKRKLPDWVDGDVTDRTIHVKTIRYPRDEEENLDPVEGVTKYMLKGVDKRCGVKMKIIPKSQGVVYGKRVGTSMNIGLAARQAFQTSKKSIERTHRLSTDTFRDDGILHEETAVKGDVGSADMEFPDVPDFLRRK